MGASAASYHTDFYSTQNANIA